MQKMIADNNNMQIRQNIEFYKDKNLKWQKQKFLSKRE